jgi:hypothetical protein
VIWSTDKANRVLRQGGCYVLILQFDASGISDKDINLPLIQHIKKSIGSLDNDPDMDSRMESGHSADDLADNCLGWNGTGADDQFTGVISFEEMQITLKPGGVPYQVRSEFNNMPPENSRRYLAFNTIKQFDS